MTEEYNLLDRVKKLAKEQNKTLSDIEKAGNLGTRSIYSWKKISPNTKNLETVATILNTSTDYLLGRTDDPTPIDSFFRIDMKNVPEDKREDFKRELTLLRDFAFKRLKEEEEKLDNQE